MIFGELRCISVCLLLAVLSACGGGSGTDSSNTSGQDSSLDSSYFPYSLDNRWGYQTISSVNGNPEETFIEVVKVTGSEVVDGAATSELTEFNPAGSAFFQGRYVIKPDGLYYAGRLDGLDPFGLGTYKLVNFPMGVNDSYTQIARYGIDYGKDLDGDGRNETLTLLADIKISGKETIVVPAGKFEDCFLLQTDTTQILTLTVTGQRLVVTTSWLEWYARDIGAVKRVFHLSGNGCSETDEFSLLSYYVNGQRSDTTAPEALSAQPTGTFGGGTTSPISVQFSEEMDPTTLTSENFYLVDSLGQRIPGEVYGGGRSATFFPRSALGSENYTATVSTGVEDLAGNGLASLHQWTFTVDVTPPEIVATFPPNLASHVAPSTSLTVTFSEAMTPSSLNSSTFTLKSDFGNKIPGSIIYDSGTMTFTPSFALQKGESYTATLSLSIKDAYGNSLANIYSWRFTVEPPLFGRYVTIPIGSDPDAIAIGDVNNDGRNDIVMTTFVKDYPENDYKLFVFLQNADGTLAPASKYATGGSFSAPPRSVAIGDVNHDGRNDIVVGLLMTSLEVFLQDDNGGLAPRVSYPSIYSAGVQIADLNNDGLLDVVGAWNGVGVFCQQPDGTLGTSIVTPLKSQTMVGLEIEDMNNDGLLDVAGGYVNLYQTQGGRLSAPVYYNGAPVVFPRGMGIGDINGDGLLDVALSTGGNWPSSKINVILQNSSGGFDPIISYSSYDIPGPIEVSDVNGDGLEDIIVLHEGWSSMGVYLQTAGGQLLPEERFNSISYPADLAIGDINGDGKPDAVTNDYFKGLVIHYNTGSNVPTPVSLSVASPQKPSSSFGFTGVSLR